MTDQAFQEIQILAGHARQIGASSATGKTKYDLIFSPDIAGRIRDIDPDFEWYDPDGTYGEDVSAFVRALNERATELGKAFGVHVPNGD